MTRITASDQASLFRCLNDVLPHCPGALLQVIIRTCALFICTYLMLRNSLIAKTAQMFKIEENILSQYKASVCIHILCIVHIEAFIPICPLGLLVGWCCPYSFRLSFQLGKLKLSLSPCASEHSCALKETEDGSGAFQRAALIFRTSLGPESFNETNKRGHLLWIA